MGSSNLVFDCVIDHSITAHTVCRKIFLGLIFGRILAPSQLKNEKFLLRINELPHEISNDVVCATNKDSDQPVHAHSLSEPLLVP